MKYEDLLTFKKDVGTQLPIEVLRFCVFCVFVLGLNESELCVNESDFENFKKESFIQISELNQKIKEEGKNYMKERENFLKE